MVIRGSAGSGKTVALHRLLIFIWRPPAFCTRKYDVHGMGEGICDYVGHVLPHLGISGLRAQTWTSWSRKIFRQHFPKCYPRWPSRLSPCCNVSNCILKPCVVWAVHSRYTAVTQYNDQVYQDWAHILTDFGQIPQDLESSWTLSMQDEPKVRRTANRFDVDLHGRFPAWRWWTCVSRCWRYIIATLRISVTVGKLTHGTADCTFTFGHWWSAGLFTVRDLILLDVCDDKQSVTLLGDTRQHISKSADFHRGLIS